MLVLDALYIIFFVKKYPFSQFHVLSQKKIISQKRKSLERFTILRVILAQGPC